MKRMAFVIGALLLVSAVACGNNKKTATPVASKVTVKTSEYAYSVSSTFKGGLVEMTIDNSSAKEAHEAELVRLDEGKTLADLKAALAQENAPPPSFAHPSGGAGPVPPGKTAVYTANLEAGTYAFLCHLPAPDGKDHLEHGMIGEARVTAGTSGSLPSADATIDMSEFKFAGMESLKAGTQKVRVNNVGVQPHNAALFALAPGKKAADVAAFFATQGPPSGPPPFTGFPGLQATTAPEGSAVRTLELQAGVTYVFWCFIPDTDGTPHAAKGMVAEFAV